MTARDARRAALRALLLAGGPAAAAIALAGPRVDPAFLLTCVCGGLGVFVLAWLETRTWRDERSFAMPFAVWLCAFVGVGLLPLQYGYVSGVLEGASLEAGLERAQQVLAGRGVPGPLLLLWLAAAAPFAVAADLRRHGGRVETTVAALVVVGPAACMSLGIVLVAALLVLLGLQIVYSAADLAEGALWPTSSRAERAAYWERSRGWSYARRWLLAYLDHPPARAQEGTTRVPSGSRDLAEFVEGLRPGGRGAYEQASLVVLRLLVPYVDDPTGAAREAVVALERRLGGADASPVEDDGGGDAARLVFPWTSDDAASRVFKDVVLALDGAPPCSTVGLGCYLIEATHALSARMQDDVAAREAIRSALIAWALTDR